MGIPGFTAEASLYRSARNYYSLTSDLILTTFYGDIGFPATLPGFPTLPAFQIPARECNLNGLEVCKTEVISSFGSCMLRCAPWCSNDELLSGKATTVTCALCLQDRKNCYINRDNGLKGCEESFGCPSGTFCTYNKGARLRERPLL